MKAVVIGGTLVLALGVASTEVPAHAAAPRHVRVVKMQWVYTPTDVNVSGGVGGAGLGCLDGTWPAPDCFALTARHGERRMTLDARTLGEPVFGVYSSWDSFYANSFCGDVTIPVEPGETIWVSFTTVQSPRPVVSGGARPCPWSPTGQLTATFR